MDTIGKPRLLVIGGTGFIGHHLLAATRNNYQVTSVSLNPPRPERLVTSVRYRQMDIRDLNAVKTCLDGEYDFVVNLGGYIDHRLYMNGGDALIEEHFRALQNLISALSRKSLKCFVQVGSSDEYGNSPAPQGEDVREQSISPYSFAKLASTHFLQMLSKTEFFPVVVLRLFLVYGPYQNENRFLPQIIKACRRNEQFPVSPGMQIRDFCYVEDVVKAIMLALTSKGLEGQVFNIGSGEPRTIRQVIEKVQVLAGGGMPQYGANPYRVGENMSLYANIQKAQEKLGWSPQVTIGEGLRKTIESYGAYNV